MIESAIYCNDVSGVYIRFFYLYNISYILYTHFSDIIIPSVSILSYRLLVFWTKEFYPVQLITIILYILHVHYIINNAV